MTLARLWSFLAVALPVLATLIANLTSVDLAYHLRAGGDILATGAIPTLDTYTYTIPGQPWIDQQWAAQVLLAAVFQAAGWSGLVLLRAVLVAITFGCVYAVARHRGVDERSAALLSIAAFLVASVALALRPQLFGMALFGLTLLGLAWRRERPAALLAVPVLAAAWANVHGSFFVGVLAVGWAWLEDLRERHPAARRTFATLVATVVATGLTPFGPSVWVYAAGLSTNPLVADRISEWQPSAPRDIPGLAFFLSGFAVAWLLARRGERASWPTLLWLGGLFLLGAYAIRGVAWWPVGAAVAVAPMLVTQPPAPVRPGVLRLNAAVAVMIVAAGVVLLPFWRPSDPVMGPSGVVGIAPPGITKELQRIVTPGDRLFHPQPWGSWFEFAIPEALVYADSRIELFPPEIWDDYDTITGGRPGWEEVLERWGVDYVIVAEDADDLLEERLPAAGWRLLYEDEDGWIFGPPGTG